MTENGATPKLPEQKNPVQEELDHFGAHWAVHVFGPIFLLGELVAHIVNALRPSPPEQKR